MIKHTILIALRRFKGSFLINSLNFLGLTAGFSIFIVLGLYYLQETSYEKGLTDSENIYRINTRFIDAKHMASSSANLLYVFKDAPEVLASTHVELLPSGKLEIGEKEVYSTEILRVDSDFLEIFDFTLLSGYAKTKSLPEQTVLLSEDFAMSRFGTLDLAGEEIWFGQDRLEVLDIIEPNTHGSHLSFDALIVKPKREYNERNWLSVRNSSGVYIKVAQGTSQSVVEERLMDISREIIYPAMSRIMHFVPEYTVDDWTESGRSIYNFPQPIEDIHLDEPLVGDEKQTVSRSVINTFGLVAILILFISCLNFIHFTTAKSTLRMKEVGVKRTLGSGRVALVLQFLAESFIWSLLAVLLAVGIVELLLQFSTYKYSELFFIRLSDAPNYLGALVLLAISVGVISSIYPATYLTRNKLANALRASSYFSIGTGTGHSILKRLIVILQFALASFLVLACVFMVRQAELMQKLDLGFRPENSLAIDLSRLDLQEKTIFKKRLTELGSVSNIASFSELPGDSKEQIQIAVESSDGYEVNVKRIRVNGSLTNSLGIELIEGKSFNEDERDNVVLLSLRAAQLLGDNGEIGQTVQGAEVIGIVDDFYYSSLRKGIEPMLFVRHNSAEQNLLVQTKSGLDQVRSVWSDISAAPFEYSWLSDRFESQQNREVLIVNLFTGFTAFAVLISLLGLFSLGLFIFEQREREFGIRKILGASPAQIIRLFSSGTSKLLLIGFALACPLAIYGIRYWLRNFSEVVPINASGVLLAAIIAFGSALLAILLQSMYAARINPVETLRNE
ncbi:ABC transporter permease [uncultured Roseivirga sp.]|uniref:ABC transporter permease n=1 Tax=uncultured Roseivirga sp. TaxID=543088 RepID=UPI000D7A8332|nr:ABC transporter permease [uncultured Roseivirga sp.]PWL28452.1 MAG: hypothetical protein DCO95_13885 [Roseivirga sp. XM-24bin3]